MNRVIFSSKATHKIVYIEIASLGIDKAMITKVNPRGFVVVRVRKVVGRRSTVYFQVSLG